LMTLQPEMVIICWLVLVVTTVVFVVLTLLKDRWREV